MRALSDKDIDALANRVNRAYRQLPEAKEAPYRVNPELLITKLLGLTVKYRHLSPNRRALGVTAFLPMEIEVFDGPEEFVPLDGKTVLVEEDLTRPEAVVGLRHFTLAHEGCHHILHMVFPKRYDNSVVGRKPLYYRIDHVPVEIEEKETDRLASAMLMPADLLFDNLAQCGIPNGIHILDSITRPREYEKFVQVSTIMGVSKQALSIRMRKLGLLDKEYLQNPFKMLDIYKEDDEDEV